MLSSNQNGAQLFTTGRGLVRPHSVRRSFANPLATSLPAIPQFTRSAEAD